MYVHVCVRQGGRQREILPVWCALHHSLVCIMSGGPCDAAARRAGGKRGEGRGRSIPSRPPNPLLTARGLLAGRHENERERVREREEGEREQERERESVCVRVSVCARGLHHRIPFTVSAGGHALMERIKLTTLSFSSDLTTTVSFQM